MKTMTWETTLERVQRDVVLVEEELRRQTKSDVDLVQKVNEHTLSAGGKRLRPAFVLIAAQAVSPAVDKPRVAALGACMELVHMATLIHDDVIDHAATRRGLPTAASVFGNTAAILSGDVLLARSMKILAQDGDLAIIRATSVAVEEMAEGEALEVQSRHNFDLTLAEHERILRMKTAAFVECCCRVGGLAAMGNLDQVEGLARYGHHLGMAFQIVDDLLDFRGNPETTGKPLATDFKEGCATLPLIYLRDDLFGEDLDFVRSRFGQDAPDSEIETLKAWMETRGCFNRALARAQEHADQAGFALEALPNNEFTELLKSIIGLVMERSK